ncbi:MAG: response regulator transcription factor [Alphaproteobacteria bacterium]|nr:MAG: response regulator transcription factor [Alphaproteobacteria bacterium]
METGSESDRLLVAVLDDDLDLAESVARLLARQGHKARAFAAPHEVLEALVDECLGCVVSDVQMPEMDGFVFAEALRGADPAIAIIFMTAWPITGHAVDAVRRYGGLDYLEKPLDERRLVDAVVEGVAWSAKMRRAAQATSDLSRREREVFDLLVRGHSNKEIAELLAISPRTVEDHRAAIVSKTRVSGLSQLIAISRGDVT